MLKWKVIDRLPFTAAVEDLMGTLGYIEANSSWLS